MALTTVVMAISYYHFRANKIKDIRDRIHLTASSISKHLIVENYPLIIKEIQQKTFLQEIAIFSSTCSLKASTSLSIPNLCKNNDLSFNSFSLKINSTSVLVFYKFNYPFSFFLRTNQGHLLILFLLFFVITSLILYIFLKNSLLAPIYRLKNHIKSSNQAELPEELDFIGEKLFDLKSEIELIEKDRTYFNLARQVVHDIRNPLAYLKLMSLENELNIDSLNKKIKEIDYQINNLLSPSNKDEMEVDINLFSSDLREELSKLFKMKLIIRSNMDQYLFRMTINNFDLKNIFSNLAKNSLEAGADTIDIEIATKDCFLEFIITDNGSGVNPNDLNKIFLKNFTSKKNGNGIGLFSIKSLVEKNRGFFIHNSIYTKGAQFTLRIPFSPTRHTYVMIDDDKFIRQAWKVAADKKGIQLFQFTSIQEFLNSTETIPRETPIYVDSNLGNEKGELDSEKIYKIGFKSIFLATSFDDIDISLYPWLTSLATKQPPF